jgi:microcystin-dependent protein
MGTTSTVNGLPAPADADANDVVADLLALIAVVDTGSLAKRLTSAQVAALTAPQKPAGLLVYNSTTGLLELSNGSGFTEIPGITPIGGGVDFYGTAAPAGWLMADGSAVSRTTYAALFAALGTTYGAGNGSTTFNLPNRCGRVAVARDVGQTEFDVLGETGGSKTSVAPHTHPIDHDHPSVTSGGMSANVTHSQSVSIPISNAASGGTDTAMGGGGQTGTLTNGSTSSANLEHTHPVDVPAYAGASGAASAAATSGNLQPYIVVNHIIRAI